MMNSVFFRLFFDKSPAIGLANNKEVKMFCKTRDDAEDRFERAPMSAADFLCVLLLVDVLHEKA